MFCPCLFLFVWGRGEKVTALLRRSSSRGLDTPEPKIASVPIPAFTANKMASSNLQIREEEQPPDRPEPAQIARDRALKQTKSKYKTSSIIFKNEHNFSTFYKSSTASIIGIFSVFLKGTLPESRLAWSLRLIIFKFCPWFSLFSFVWGKGKKVTAILRRSSSRGLCTP